MSKQDLKPAAELARHDRRFPNEPAGYRAARTALLAEEIELRRHTERVAQLRRAMPVGGKVPEDYQFVGEEGPVKLSELFAGKPTLITYNWMFGPERERPCPMCTSLLSALDGEMPDILQRVAFVVFARSPIERMVAFKKERGWRHLRLYSSGGNGFNAAYAFEQPGSGEDNAAFNVFTRKGGAIHHFWGDEMGPESADPGQDPRGAVNAMPIWNLLDITPEGRAPDWYPKLEYGKA
jgi:predicted dithiol-disulfide oxidoreductase (DUF899 family)